MMGQENAQKLGSVEVVCVKGLDDNQITELVQSLAAKGNPIDHLCLLLPFPTTASLSEDGDLLTIRAEIDNAQEMDNLLENLAELQNQFETLSIDFENTYNGDIVVTLSGEDGILVSEEQLKDLSAQVGSENFTKER